MRETFIYIFFLCEINYFRFKKKLEFCNFDWEMLVDKNERLHKLGEIWQIQNCLFTTTKNLSSPAWRLKKMHDFNSDIAF